MFFVFKPTKQKLFNKNLLGFDCETYDNNKRMYCCSFYDGKKFDTFFNPQDSIKFLKGIYESSFLSATNLGFDFFSIFDKESDELKHFRLCYRSSDMISAKTLSHSTRYDEREFSLKRKDKNDAVLTFIDTLNYAKLSVETIGKILGLPKLEHPGCLGRMPETDAERDELITYNRRDAEISYRFIEFLFSAFTNFGATPKMTIASTAKSLFTNKYLHNVYFRHSPQDLLQQFSAYYGGRCEAFWRGKIGRCNYYDFNSLYPSVMRGEYPDPNSMRKNRIDNDFYIQNYEGVADAEVVCPKADITLLPLRIDNKLLFPYGRFRGWYSNVELRRAIDLGYSIEHTYRNIYFTRTCFPFREFVDDLYGMRMKYQADKSPMEQVCKLLMNSLYGKFGQKFIDRDNWFPIDSLDINWFEEHDDFERVGRFVRLTEKFQEPKAFCIPIWALYTTAYGRLKLYDSLKRVEPFYCDTDSIITTADKFLNSKELGKLKREMQVQRGIIVKPKFYALIDSEGKEHVKIKGIAQRIFVDDIEQRMTMGDFTRLMDDPKVMFNRFMKFKESIRRDFIINEVQRVTKELLLEDTKRSWHDEFDCGDLQASKSLLVLDNEVVREPGRVAAAERLLELG
jgi:hypothetical protein